MAVLNILGFLFVLVLTASAAPTVYLNNTVSNEKTNSNQSSCIVTDSKGNSYDLSPIRQVHRNYLAINHDDGMNTIYALNLCAPILRKNGMETCDDKAIACVYNKPLNKTETIGLVDTSRSISNATNPTLEYTSKTECIYKPDATYSISIEFKCDPLSGKGVPLLKEHMDLRCNYQFLWPTAYVCSKAEIEKAQKDISGDDNCRYFDPYSEQVIDMNPLKRDSAKPYRVPSNKTKSDNYLINICGPAAQKSDSVCGTSGICKVSGDKEISYGPYKNLSIITDKRNLTLSYGSGENCQSDKTEAVINFICDRKAGYGNPVIKEESDCNVLFEWRTIHTCVHKEPTCQFVANGIEYDLTRLSIAHKDWNYTDTEGNQYWINPCGEINHKRGCERDAAVCVANNKTGKIYTVGRWSEQWIVNEHKNKDYIGVEYGGGDKGLCENDPASVRITFSCYSKAKSPQLLVVNSQCKYSFEWDTPIACGTEVKEIDEHNMIIYDKYEHISYNMTDLFSREIITVSKTDNVIYNMNIVNGTSPCSGATVCQLETLGSGINIGEWKTRKIYKGRDDTITLSMSSEVKCHNNYVPQSHITLICDPKAKLGESVPEYMYENQGCETFFEWRTDQICSKMGRNMTDAQWDEYAGPKVSYTAITVVICCLTLLIGAGIGLYFYKK